MHREGYFSMKLNERKFGIEFEFSSSFNTLEPLIRGFFKPSELNVEETYKKSNGKKYELKLDSTTSCEFATKTLTYDQLPRIEALLKLLNDNNIKVGNCDGLHIHIYARDVSQKNLIIAWMSVEGAILKLFPKHRRKGFYTQSYIERFRKKDLLAHHYMAAYENCKDHHFALSLQNHNERGRWTVEFRTSEGSLDFNHIKNWLRFCILFLEYAKHFDEAIAMTEQVSEVNKLKHMIKVMHLAKYKQVLTWLWDRYHQFRDKKVRKH